MLRWVLIVSTVFAVPLTVLGVIGVGTMSVTGTLDAQVDLTFDDGRRITVDGNTTTFHDLDDRSMTGIVGDGLSVVGQAEVASSDLDTRLTMAAAIWIWLAAAWLGVTAFGAIVRDAIGGRAFSEENPRRLQRLGVAVLAVPVTTFIAQMILRQTFDSDLPFTPTLANSSWLVLLVVGLGVLALSPLFGEAGRLEEFEASTI